MIGINEFCAKRHIAEKPYSHFAGSWDELCSLTQAHFDNSKPGYRDGVILVTVPSDGFFSGVVQLDENTPIEAVFGARREGEAPYKAIRALVGKSPALIAEIVLYHKNVLAETGDNSTDEEWEVTSINARITEEEEPQSPLSMARNMLGLAGGTKAECTPESARKLAEAVIYWSDKAMSAGS